MKKISRIAVIALLCAAVAAALVFWFSSMKEPVPVQPPELVIAWGEEEIPAWRGGYQWTWHDGLALRGAMADSPHPLDAAEDLPGISAKAGDTLTLAFGGVPDRVEVMYCPAGASALDAQVTFWQLSNGNQLTLPGDCAGTVWVVDAKWETGAATGRAQYAFSIP